MVIDLSHAHTDHLIRELESRGYKVSTEQQWENMQAWSEQRELEEQIRRERELETETRKEEAEAWATEL